MKTILFATYNGSSTLPRMLDSFLQLETLADDWEIVAVDNGSNDNTSTIIKSYQDTLPIKYICEPQKGKNHALNRGLLESTGDLIIITDDDIIADPSWLVKLIDCAKINTEYNIFGGTIKPFWPCSRIPNYIHSIPKTVAFALTRDDALTDGPIRAGEVYGPNMMVRRSLFDDGILFNTNIGPNGKNYAMGSETEFTTRAVNEYGASCYFCASSVVYHIVRKNQLTKKWLLGRAFRSGRGNAARTNSSTSTSRSIFNVPLWIYKIYLKKQLISWLSYRSELFANKWKANYYRGYLYECLKTYFSK